MTIARVLVGVSFGALTACGPLTEHVDPSVCKSETRWIGDDSGDSEMKPGNECISCHRREDGPGFTFAGTVYSEPHQNNDCFGVSGVEVRIQDASGQVFESKTNAAGNFHISADVQFPYTASIRQGGVELKMATAQTVGDCNSCHTRDGANLAVGRIFLPPATAPAPSASAPAPSATAP